MSHVAVAVDAHALAVARSGVAHPPPAAADGAADSARAQLELRPADSASEEVGGDGEGPLLGDLVQSRSRRAALLWPTRVAVDARDRARVPTEQRGERLDLLVLLTPQPNFARLFRRGWSRGSLPAKKVMFLVCWDLAEADANVELLQGLEDC